MSNTVFTVINDNVNLETQQILAYLRPQTSNTSWVSSAWQACSPQVDGGKATLNAIINTISATGTFSDGKDSTSTVDIPAGQMATFTQDGNVIVLGVPADSTNLTSTQSGVYNTTAVKDLYPVWSLNGGNICKPANPMYNTGDSSFELLQKIYFTIGSQELTDTFILQNWTDLQEFDVPSNLVSADINVSIDATTNTPVFEMDNKVFA